MWGFMGGIWGLGVYAELREPLGSRGGGCRAE